MVAAFVLIMVITSVRGIASFWTTYLWYRELHVTSVWRGVLLTKVVLALVFSAIFFVGLWTSLYVADRLAPRFLGTGPDLELVQRYRDTVGPHAAKVRLAVAALFGLLIGTGMSGEWNKWILFNHSVNFPATVDPQLHKNVATVDPQFHKNVSFFVFRLPFLNDLVGWAFLAVVVISIVTVVAHYLNGGIRMQATGQRVTPQVKAHISVLLGLLAAIKAVGYYLQRYELDFSTRGVVRGATYTDVKAQLPALVLLILISLASLVIFLYNIRRQGWVLPVIGVGLWAFVSVLVGAIVPAFIQKFTVQPSENSKERPYILRNINATRAALDLNNVKTESFDYTPNLTATDLNNNAATIHNVRLWDPAFVGVTYQKLQEIRSYYAFPQLGIDRYDLGGTGLTEAIVSARELNGADLPSQSFVNKRLQYTHGYGAILAPANAVTTDGKPVFDIQDIPPVSTGGAPDITEPRVYYGRNTTGYVIAATSQKELDFQTDKGTTESSYAGKGGVAAGSILRRAAFALRFSDLNPLISGQVTSRSRVMFNRDVATRVRQAAPFLKLDSDPYAVIVNGRIVWVQDTYTTTNDYPYAALADVSGVPAASGLKGGLTYIRNSVKATVDAYDGTVTFYLVDDTDPLAESYAKAFPKLFKPFSAMPTELRQHLRYPEDMFNVQTSMYGRYHLTDPQDFYSQANAWVVSQDPGSGSPSAPTQTTATTNAQGVAIGQVRAKRMDPAYLVMKLPNEPDQSFLIIRPFVPVSQGDKQQNLTAFMTAKSDPSDYGKLQVFVTPPGQEIDGPALIDSRIAAYPAISTQISLLNTQGSEVKFGNVLIIPVEKSIIYARPLYVQSDRNPLPQLKFVIVVSGDKAAMEPTLQGALTKIFGGAPPTLEQAAASGQGTTTTTPTTTSPGGAPTTVAGLLDQAVASYNQAQTDLKNGDLAAYQKDIKNAQSLVAQADQQAGGAASPPGGGATTTTATSAPGG